MNETNFSLLNQKEIDTLVTFLSQSKDTVNSDVLSQDSIDKLIRLISHDGLSSVRLDELEAIHVQIDILGDLGIREDPTQVCELTFQVDPETEFLTLTATNTSTGKTYPISPAALDHLEVFRSSISWGYSMPPILFNKIARIFNCKYSRKTYKNICALYALKNYGSEDLQLPSLYYPTTNQLLASLL